MQNRSELVARLKQALLAKDMLAMQLAMVDFPDGEGPAESLRLLQEEIPDDVRAWWLEEECDLSHDPLDLEAEALPIVEHLFRRQREEE